MRTLSTLTTAVASVALLGLAALPAAADRPLEFQDGVTFVDVDPCSGGLHEVALEADVRLHLHDAGEIVFLDTTGTTSSGYVMESGVEIFVRNSRLETSSFAHMWTREDGSRFQARGGYVYDFVTGELKLDRFEARCIHP